MKPTLSQNLTRRQFLQRSAVAAAAAGTGLGAVQVRSAAGRSMGRTTERVVIIGIDGMDPFLTERMMDAGELVNLQTLRTKGGYRRLGTSIPPQSPVAWANFINGAGPGSHGIFDFIHRDPARQCVPFFAAAETLPGAGYWHIGEYKLQLNFWPFGHKPPQTVLRRQGVPFWDYLDRAGVSSTFYDLPSNYPPSISRYGHHRCLAGLGTPDLLGTYGTYQHFSEDGPVFARDEPGGKRSMLFFENETATLELTGPDNRFLKTPEPATIELLVHRDVQADAAVLEIQNQKILLKPGQWSDWTRLDFALKTPALIPDKHISAICRFYLQQVSPNFRLYVSPINADPSAPAVRLSEPASFVEDISRELGLFYTTGFQEDHKALSNRIFTDAEFAAQAEMVLQERLNLLQYAMEHYDDGLLFFYFSSTDLQSHMFWWDSAEKHPVRSTQEAAGCFDHIKQLYRRMDEIVGRVITRYGNKAAVIVMSDHGFANFRRQFNLNTWLRNNGYIQPPSCKSILRNVDWSRTRAYGLGINGLYLNLKGRERDGIVEPDQREALLQELTARLEAVRDSDPGAPGPVIRKVHRADEVYKGQATALAPDLIVGYCRDYRASWATCLGDIGEQVLLDNDSAWSADHCADVSELPGVLFSNRPITAGYCSLIDIAPSVLPLFGLKVPDSMTGTNIFST